METISLMGEIIGRFSKNIPLPQAQAVRNDVK